MAWLVGWWTRLVVSWRMTDGLVLRTIVSVSLQRKGRAPERFLKCLFRSISTPTYSKRTVMLPRLGPHSHPMTIGRAAGLGGGF
jgi:hypothetical protein